MVRPRMDYPTELEVPALGEDLVKWATEPTDPTEPPRTAWSFWYALVHGMQEKHWKALKKYEEFRPYYEIARAALAQKTHSNVLEKGMAHRYVGLYERDLYHFEDEKADKDAIRKENVAPKENNFTFKVNYNNAGNTVEVLPESVPASNS